MTLLFYIYLFLQPLEIYLERLPKGPTGLNYANLSMVFLILFWFIGRTARGRSLVMPSPLNLPVLGMLGWTYFGMALTSLTIPAAPSAFDPLSESFKSFLQFFNAFLLFFFAANVLDSRRKVYWALVTLCLTSVPVVRAFRSDLVAVATWHYSNDMRVRGPFVWIGSNELGAFFVYGSLFLGLFALHLRRLWEKGLFFGASALYCYGILYSYSRATQLAFLAAAALVSAIRYRFTIVLMLLLALTASLWLPVSVRERWSMTRTDEGQLEVSAQSRKDFAVLAWEMSRQSPLIGHGIGSYKLLNPASMDTHNHYLRTLAESGLIGLGVLMSLWVTILWMNFKVWRGGRQPFDRHYGFCLMIATVGLMITNLFGDRFTHFSMIGHYWVLVGMGARFYADMTGVEAMTDSAAQEPAAQDFEESSIEPARQSAAVNVVAPASLAVQVVPKAKGLRSLAPAGLNVRRPSAPEPSPRSPTPPELNLVRPGNGQIKRIS